MVFKLLLVIILLKFNLAYSNIIYEKNGISITDIEINKYIQLYKNSYGDQLTINKALKEIVLVKKTINFVITTNPEYMLNLEDKITSEYGEEVSKDEILFNFLKFQKIRSEFISDYFQSKFSIDDLKFIFQSFNEVKLPISKNDCLIIEKLYEVNRNEYFINNFLENLKNNQRKFRISLDNEIYDVCINDDIFKKIELSIINFIKNKTDGDFNKFIYGKIN